MRLPLRRLIVVTFASAVCLALWSLWLTAGHTDFTRPSTPYRSLSILSIVERENRDAIDRNQVTPDPADQHRDHMGAMEHAQKAPVTSPRQQKGRQRGEKEAPKQVTVNRGSPGKGGNPQTSSTIHTALMSNLTTLPSPQTTVRPANCSGCFKTDFPVLIDQPQLCRTAGKANVDMVLLVISSPANGASRAAIRSTWGSVTRNNTSTFRHVFMLGDTPDPQLAHAVKEEAGRFQDVVMVGFHDSYRNLTVKVVSALRWVTTRCPEARFFMKVDDDVWVDMAILKPLIYKNAQFFQQGFAGACNTKTKPIRDPKHKWYVPRNVYPEGRYPDYCSGLAYISSLRVARQILKVSVDIPFFAFEDVYVGMCVKRLGLRLRNFGHFKQNYKNKTLCQAKHARVATVHGLDSATMLQMWSIKCPAPRRKAPAKPRPRPGRPPVKKIAGVANFTGVNN